MFAARSVRLLSAATLPLLAGCQLVPKTHLDAAESHNRVLVDQKNALLAENENLRTHSRQLEEQVKQAEEELAVLEEHGGSRIRIARQAPMPVDVGPDVPASINQRFAQLAEQYEALEYDPDTGASKFNTQSLFDRGKADLRRDARPLFDAFADLLKSPDARELRIIVVGHTDDRSVGKRQARDGQTDHWRLASARALAVAEYLRQRGVPDAQLAVTAVGQHPPVGSNPPATGQEPGPLEIFVTGPNTPIVGWTETKDLY